MKAKPAKLHQSASPDLSGWGRVVGARLPSGKVEPAEVPRQGDAGPAETSPEWNGNPLEGGPSRVPAEIACL